MSRRRSHCLSLLLCMPLLPAFLLLLLSLSYGTLLLLRQSGLCLYEENKVGWVEVGRRRLGMAKWRNVLKATYVNTCLCLPSPIYYLSQAEWQARSSGEEPYGGCVSGIALQGRLSPSGVAMGKGEGGHGRKMEKVAFSLSLSPSHGLRKYSSLLCLSVSSYPCIS